MKTGIYLMLLMPFLVSTGSPLPFDTASLFPFIVGKALYARALIEVTFALWLLLIWVAPRYRPPRSWILGALLVYLLITLVAGIAGVSFTRSLWSNYERMGGIVDLTHWVAFVMVLGSVLRTESAWRAVLNFSLSVSAAMAVIGLAQHYDVQLLPNLSRGVRVDGTLGNATFMGAYLLVNFFLALAFLADSFVSRTPIPAESGSPASRRGRRECLAALRQERQTARREAEFINWWRAFWIATAALDLWVLWLTGTRGALIGLVAALVVAAIAYLVWGDRRWLKQAALGLIAVLAVLGVMIFAIRDTTVGDKLADSSAMLARVMHPTGSSLEQRAISTRAGAEAFLHRPVLGWGPENFTVAFDRYVGPRYFEITSNYTDKAHNKLVEDLTTKGALGFLSYGVLWALLLWVLAAKIQSQRPEGLFFYGVGAALVGYFVQNIFLFDTPAPLLQFMLLVGLMVAVEGHMLPQGAPPQVRTPAKAAESAAANPHSRRRRAERRQQPGLRYFASQAGEAFLRRVRRLRATETSFQMATGVAAVLLLTAVGLLIYHANYRPYREATLISSVLSNPNLVELPWEQRITRAQEAFTTFTPLANQSRTFFFDVVGNNWGNMNDQTRRSILALADKESEVALHEEPQSVQVHLHFAELYQSAASLDPANLERARQLLDRAKELAPHRTQVLLLLDRQEKLEQEFGER